MNNHKTLKALDALAKWEYWTASALDAALAEAEDAELRKSYRRWRDAHLRQAERLTERITELGGHTKRYEFGHDPRRLRTRLTAPHEYKSVAGMRVIAERGIQQYVVHIEEIDDPETLDVIRKNLQSKRREMQWYDDQVAKQHGREVKTVPKETNGAKNGTKGMRESKEAIKTPEKQVKAEKKGRRGGGPLAALAAAGIIGTAAYLVSRRNEDADGDNVDNVDNSDDLVSYEPVENAEPVASSV